MNLHQLRVLSAVVQEQSFSKAAQKLMMTQPAVSARVQALEKTFGTPLLLRHGRRVEPTEAGAAVYDYAQKMLIGAEELQQYVRQLRDAEAGTVRLGASSSIGTYILPPLLVQFKRRYPKASITVETAHGAAIRKHLLDGELDFSVVAASPEDDFGEPLTALPLRVEPMVIVARPEHPLLRLNKVRPADLQEYELITILPASAPSDIASRQLAKAGVSSRPTRSEFTHAEAVKLAVRYGDGVGVLFKCSVDRELMTGELCEVNVQGVEVKGKFCLVYRVDKHFSPLARNLSEFLGTRMTDPAE